MSKSQKVSAESVKMRNPASALRRESPTIQAGVEPKGKDKQFSTDAGLQALAKMFKGRK